LQNVNLLLQNRAKKLILQQRRFMISTIHWRQTYPEI